LATNTHKALRLLAYTMRGELQELDSGFYDRRLVGPINFPYL
jgi:hypothetical protein